MQKIVFQGRKKFPGGECPRTLLARYHYITYVYYAARNNLSENIVFRMSIEQYRIIKDHLDFATPTPPPPPPPPPPHKIVDIIAQFVVTATNCSVK